MARQRLDTLLAERGLFGSRNRAAAAVMAGEVRISGSVPKPGLLVTADVEVELADRPQYVSRGATKLANALGTLDVEVAGRHCLDVGASTGGFTDCLLQRGAERVIALDVAYGELALKLREHERVDVVERTNARSIEPSSLPWTPDLIVCDVSFISLAKILPAVLGCAAPSFDCLAMIKPQFEVGREQVGKGGVVRDSATRRGALTSVGAVAIGLGCAVLGYASSGLPGPAGNQETFVWIAEAGRAGALDDIEGAARRVEP